MPGFVARKGAAGPREVQGMAEILAPIYYVYATDASEEWKAHAEADAYWSARRTLQ